VTVFGKMQNLKVETRSIHELSINTLPKTLFSPAVSEACVPQSISADNSNNLHSELLNCEENQPVLGGNHVNSTNIEHLLSSEVVPGRYSSPMVVPTCNSATVCNSVSIPSVSATIPLRALSTTNILGTNPSRVDLSLTHEVNAREELLNDDALSYDVVPTCSSPLDPLNIDNLIKTSRAGIVSAGVRRSRDSSVSTTTRPQECGHDLDLLSTCATDGIPSAVSSLPISAALNSDTAINDGSVVLPSYVGDGLGAWMVIWAQVCM